jgi:plasmid stability protein
MAELHLTDVDDEVLARLRQRAEKENRPVEALAREELERAVSFSSTTETAVEESFGQSIEQIRFRRDVGTGPGRKDPKNE